MTRPENGIVVTTSPTMAAMLASIYTHDTSCRGCSPTEAELASYEPSRSMGGPA